jgi:ryanodine receptor 2
VFRLKRVSSGNEANAAIIMKLGLRETDPDCGGALATYTPKTIDTSHIRLPPGLEELVEKLAQNNHDHWARKRIEEGWRFGANRNDSKKEHPDLLPYDQLPESEKEYDRKTVVEALKAIIALGYDVTRRQ